MTPFRLTLGAALAATAIALAGPAWADLKVQNGHLVEASGRPFVIRGVNVHHAWAPERTRQSLKDIAATGANTVRVVLSDGSRWKRTPCSQVAAILNEADRLKLVVILEVHDATGFGDPGPDAKGAVHLGTLIPYWLSLKPLIEGREDRVLVNIANEPFSVRGQPSPWFEAHRTAIAALRAAGLRHVLVVDGDDYGQDSSGTMRDRAAALLAADPQHNTLFSVHMYQVYGQGETVRAYLDAFQGAGLPLIVGEFGPDHAGEPVDEATIMRLSAERQIGWLAWSWSGNSRKVADLDMVQGFDAARPSPWGQRVIDGPDGLRQTARPAEVFAGPLRRPPVWRRALARLRGSY